MEIHETIAEEELRNNLIAELVARTTVPPADSQYTAPGNAVDNGFEAYLDRADSFQKEPASLTPYCPWKPRLLRMLEN